MNKEFLKELASKFYDEMQSSDDLKDHIQEHLRRAQRAKRLLTLEKIPELGEDELRELFFDSDSFNFWSNKEWEFNNRLQKYGLDGLRQVILELITRAESGLTPEDLIQVWDMRGLGTLLSTELIAYRYPDRYWTYNTSVTLETLNILGEDIKSNMPRGQKSDAYMYFAIEPLLDQVQEALNEAGFSSVDYLLTDIFFWWIKTNVSAPPETDVKAIPDVETEAIEQALRTFDSERRHSPEWAGWESKENYHYAIAWQDQLYPVKEIVRMATGAEDFNSSQARDFITNKGFIIQSLEKETSNAWIFQANPRIYDLGKALRREKYNDWRITRYRDEVAEGDTVLLWKAGENRGIYGLAKIISPLFKRADGEWAVDLEYLGRLKQPIYYEDLLDDPILSQMHIMRQFQGTNFRITSQEWKALQSILGEVIPPDSDALDMRNKGEQLIPVGQLVSRSLKSRGLLFKPWQVATFYTALQTKGFVILSGISGTGKTKLAQHFASLLPQPAEVSENWTFIPVRPDWRDSKSLLGYYNPLTGTYEWTPFLRFLLKAIQSYRDNDRVAWFIILDEMNLARVEYYFADLLSVLESGRDEFGWTREPLRFVYPADAEGDLPPSELKIPPNLYIIGTVNVDETTYAFSPKVLDRAFTLELTEADFSHYLIDEDLDEFALDERLRQQIFDSFTFSGDYANIAKQRIATFIQEHGDYRDWLQTLNDALRPHELHFGYRVFDEIIAFLISAKQNQLYGKQSEDLAAFDAAILMKVMPKFHGSRSKLEQPLIEVLAWCLDPDSPVKQAITDILQDGEASVFESLARLTYKCPQTAERARRMLRALYTTGFAAFG